MKTKVNIAFASDDRGVDGLVVAGASALATISQPTDIWVIEDGIDVSSQRRIAQVWRKYSTLAEVHFISLNSLPIKLPVWWTRSKWPLSAAARFQLADILPLDAKRCIYLDIDILIGTDLVELFEINMDGFPAGMVVNSGMNEADKNYVISIGLNPDTYCNSGVLLIDLDAWRRENAGSELIALGRRMSPDLWFFDQDMLNTYFNKRVKLLDSKWNYRNAGVGPTGFVQHFAGSVKPWNTLPTDELSAGIRAWHSAKAETGFFKTPETLVSRIKKHTKVRWAQIQRRFIASFKNN